jgi:hypothetical protein
MADAEGLQPFFHITSPAATLGTPSLFSPITNACCADRLIPLTADASGLKNYSAC